MLQPMYSQKFFFASKAQIESENYAPADGWRPHSPFPTPFWFIRLCHVQWKGGFNVTTPILNQTKIWAG